MGGAAGGAGRGGPLRPDRDGGGAAGPAGRRLDAGSLERLWSATQGNALVLRELVEHALDDGSLRREREVWSWSGLAGDPPRRLADVLLLWLRDLSAREEELVGMLAVAEPLEADAVARRGLASAAEALSPAGRRTGGADGAAGAAAAGAAAGPAGRSCRGCPR
ncbi:hypothetical protein LUX09_33825 [Streptomyces albogriseolus]|nr:hypothetical protein [Streptomyces albogriseolus]